MSAAEQLREEKERRERVIREYQRRARAAVRVLTAHNLVEEYLLAYRDLRPAVNASLSSEADTDA